MLLRQSFPFLITAALLCLGVEQASAQVARHERISQKAIVKAGKPIGVKIKVVLRPEDSYTKARIGLGKMSAADIRKAHPSYTDGHLRQSGAGNTKEYLRFKGPEVAVKSGTPQELEFEVIYGQGNDLKPGDQVDVVTAWGGSSQKMNIDDKTQVPYWHIYGMFDGPANQGDKTNVIELGK